jgi:ferredoxin
MSTTAAQTIAETPFEEFLKQPDEARWSEAISQLLPEIHEVDKTATRIWFAFFPLALFREFEQTEDPEALMRELLMQGNYYLKDQIDSSHKFLYGHRFWPEVKKAVAEHADLWPGLKTASGDASAQDSAPARRSDSRGRRRSRSGTLRSSTVPAGQDHHIGLHDDSPGEPGHLPANGEILLDSKHRKSTERVLRERARDDGQGLLGFLNCRQEVDGHFGESDDTARYKMNNMQDLAWGAAEDHTRDWRAIDPRRPEGPIPVECRSAACGTCWVGVLGGAEKLADVGARENTRIKEFGYIDTAEPRPLIRLACQAQAQGAVSIVIPPWNGFFGKYMKTKSAGDAAAAPTILRGRIQK